MGKEILNMMGIRSVYHFFSLLLTSIIIGFMIIVFCYGFKLLLNGFG